MSDYRTIGRRIDDAIDYWSWGGDGLEYILIAIVIAWIIFGCPIYLPALLIRRIFWGRWV